MDTKKLERLNRVLTKIEKLCKDEDNFKGLEKLREEECRLEPVGHAPDSYKHDLEQTGWEYGENYKQMLKKRPIKGAWPEFSDYVRNFKRDVEREINRLQYGITVDALLTKYGVTNPLADSSLTGVLRK